ncbi:helix-turn-helix domain-containing protein [Streptomyces sp. NPDC002838]|uniref:MarR family transcriptional regulator n=1 Tax=Streptomyces sp. NPDC002838 TaxID=3154436 RepID=UPI00331DEE43
MTRYDYELLVHLSAEPERALTMSEPARLLKITRSRLPHAVTRLQDAGHVRRREDPVNPHPAGRPHRRGRAADGTGRSKSRRGCTSHGLRRPDPEPIRQFTETGEAINASFQRADDTGADPDALPWRRR